MALVVGANDVVNPAARNDKGSPIYGMPIIDADKARTVFAIKRSKNPGFAGIDNELYFSERTWMLFGDAKNVVGELVKQLSAPPGDALKRLLSVGSGLRPPGRTLTSNRSPISERFHATCARLAMLLPTASPAVIHAQDACADLPKFFSQLPKIGEWAEFTWQEKGKTDSRQMRMAVVKEEQRRGSGCTGFKCR